MALIGFDYETHLLGPECLAPKPVCLSAFINVGETVPPEADLEESCELATSADGNLEELARELLESGQVLVGAKPSFDLAVMAKAHPSLVPLIWKALKEGRVSDVQVREKLLNLAEHGVVKDLVLPDGSTRRLKYSLAVLAADYLGVDMTASKEDADAWRTNYDKLEDVPLSEWPEDALLYSLYDSVYPTMIHRHQSYRAAAVADDIGRDPLKCEAFRVRAAFALYLMSAHGVRIDPEVHDEIQAELAAALAPENLNLLVKKKILRPGRPPEPYASGAKTHEEGCKRKACGCPVKMKAATKSSINRKALAAFVESLGDKVTLVYSDKGNLCLDRAFLDDSYQASPVLAQYRDRQRVQKLVTTDMPRLQWPKGSGVAAPVVHTNFDELKETGRTSSYAGDLYPSWNCQNPHPRVRDCVIPREGFVLYSVDYSVMELGTLAQKCFKLFGYSALRDIINRGWCAHAYLGAQLAYTLNDDFAESCDELGANTKDARYLAFRECEGSGLETVRAFYKHYRTFAKPTGLGYPGGLGPKTFVTFAHATYKIEVTLELAKELREIWFQTFPEMHEYLEWISESCPDPNHYDGYAYVTPLGLYRADAAYCAAANGAGLQSPSAEGALSAVIAVSEATYANDGSVLYADDRGARHRPLLFIHDEIIGEVREDVAHECAHEVARIMVEEMRKVTPDVKAAAEPVLMLRWNKKAEATYVNKRLVPWTPKESQ